MVRGDSYVMVEAVAELVKAASRSLFFCGCLFQVAEDPAFLEVQQLAKFHDLSASFAQRLDLGDSDRKRH